MRLLLCASASGSGKTTVTCAILQALANRGQRLSAFKCGPDYIDPMFHRTAIGVPSRNLDLFLMGEKAVRASLARRGGLSVIEGAMGYYDGIARSEEASAYDLARRTSTPAVLVADVRAQALSAAALVKGFASFRPDSHIRVVLLNRIAPARYPGMKEAIEGETGIPVCGFLPELPECRLENRHLGLVTAAEVEGIKTKLAVLAENAEKYMELDRLLTLAGTAPPLEVEPSPGPRPVRARIAIARDKAFCFYYHDALALLTSLGAELVPFSPLEDKALPKGVGGLYLGGGYPELYAAELSQNEAMRHAIRAAIASGMPAIAECGGFLYLHETLEDKDGIAWPLCGVFPERAFPTGRLGRFGYVTLTARKDGLLGPAGTAIPAHEFHYWDSAAPGGDFRAEKPHSSRGWDCAYHTRTLYAGFPHFHLCAVPGAAERFVEACADDRVRRVP